MRRKATAVATGVRATPQGYQVYGERNGVYRSKRFPAETDILTLKRERETLVAGLVLNVEPDDSAPIQDDARDYLTLVADMPSFTDRAYHIGQWAEVFKGRPRKGISARDISGVLEQWRKTGAVDGGPLSVGSLNRRRTALMHLYTRLDGRNAYNPVKDVPKYDESGSHQDRALPLVTVARVLWRLWPKSKTRARLRVLMWTGWPHALLKGVTAEDVDWQGHRVRLGRRRKGKGLPAAWVPVLPPAIRALRRLERLNAWGDFSNSGMRSVLARAVDAENAIRTRKKQPPLAPVHPYQVRHSFATWAAGVLKDDRALKELLRTRSIERYTEGALAGRLDSARDALRGSRGSLSSHLRPRRHKDRHRKARQPKPQKGQHARRK